MSKIKEFIKSETFSYLFWGVMTTAVNYIIFIALYNVLHINSLISNTAAFIGAVLFAYFVNKIFVFKNRSWDHKTVIKEFVSFVSARIVTFLLEEAVLVGCELFELGEKTLFTVFGITVDGILAAKVIMAVVVIVLNYILCKFIVFAKGKYNSGK